MRDVGCEAMIQQPDALKLLELYEFHPHDFIYDDGLVHGHGHGHGQDEKRALKSL